MDSEQTFFTAADGTVYKKETIFKHKNRIREMKQNKAYEKQLVKKYQKEQRLMPGERIKTPEAFVHEYLNRQREYVKYKHLVGFIWF